MLEKTSSGRVLAQYIDPRTGKSKPIKVDADSITPDALKVTFITGLADCMSAKALKDQRNPKQDTPCIFG